MNQHPLLTDNSFFRRRLLWHVLFWITYYLYDGPIAAQIEPDPVSRLCGALLQLPVKMMATYFTLYVLFPMYTPGRRNKAFFLYLAGSVLVFGILQRSVSYHITYPLFYPEYLKTMPLPVLYLPKVIVEIFSTYSVVAIAATLHLVKRWYMDKQATQLLQKTMLEAELKFLKSQINPHFLFNTLNNLYTLTLTDSKKAPEIVYKLAQLMSYMLHDSNQTKVPLVKELEYIENYITLEKIRYGDRLDVSLNLMANVEGITIAPLLILPFVENSFKHGFSSQIGRVWVRVDVLTSDNKLVIKVENSKGQPDFMPDLKPTPGIGLQNVKRRLDLIYKDQYDLQLFEESDTYLVVLKLALQETPVRKEESATVEQYPYSLFVAP